MTERGTSGGMEFTPSSGSHLDLFSGIGGFALAAKWLGLQTVAFCEIDPWARKVLNKNFPNVPIHEDVKKLKGDEYGKIDIITGGFPCQPFSSLGKRAGREDDRYLWPSMLRIAKAARADWIVAENVPRIISMGLDTVFADLEREGYSATAVSVPACAVSAPHYRARIWMVAHYTGGRVNGMVGERASKASAHEGSGGHSNWRLNGTNATSAKARWEAWNGKSRVCRVANGVSKRIHGLGNAIVPQVAYEIMRPIFYSENAKHTDKP